MTATVSPSASSVISGAGGAPDYDVPLARRPCCVCPPACEIDDSGDTCIDAACSWCLHGCPTGLARPCCIEQPDDVLEPAEVDGQSPLFPAPATAAAATPTYRSAT